MVKHFRASANYQDSRDQPTRELLHVATVIKDPRQRVVFSRRINPAFAIAEVIWILAGSDDVSFLGFWNPRMRSYSDDGVRLCGAYGYRMGSQPRLNPELSSKLRHWIESDPPSGPDQLRLAYEALRTRPSSRQVVIQIWNGATDMPNPLPRSKDVPCNVAGHLMVRNGNLEWLEIMRSNDFIWGFPYNVIQFTTIQEIMAGWLGVGLGSYIHISDSLHVYQRHWAELEYGEANLSRFVPRNESNLGIKSYEVWESTFAEIVDLAYRLTQHKSADELISTYESSGHLPAGYREWVAVLTAEALRRRGFSGKAIEVAERCGKFWGTSLKLWFERASEKQASKQRIPA